MEIDAYQQRLNKKALYIDGLFLRRALTETRYFYAGLYPGRLRQHLRLSDLLKETARWLRLDGGVDVYLFTAPGAFEDGSVVFDTAPLLRYDHSVFALTFFEEDRLSPALGHHLQARCRTLDEIALVADDPAYVPLLGRVDAAAMKLLRRGNDETAMSHLGHVPWQDISYVLGCTLGLSRSEL